MEKPLVNYFEFGNKVTEAMKSRDAWFAEKFRFHMDQDVIERFKNWLEGSTKEEKLSLFREIGFLK